ncbi:PAC2 family protein [Brachybacterium sp. AOP25-B2-12]|uniref:PAC2 family protein n=1 Tax=Brachybacterium sp. AOP25-B2-12 TaxID=3457710 RepID=UPI004033C85B
MQPPETGRRGRHRGEGPTIAIAAFGGWNDAGEAATGAIAHLLAMWPSRRIATISSEEYVDFQVSRPSIRTTEDGNRVIDWPDTTVDLVTTPHGGKILLVEGPEPSMRWKAFSAEVIELLVRHGATTVVTLGSLLADAPHTRPLPVSANIEPGIDDTVDEDAYEGPIGVPTVLGRVAVTAGLRSVAVWVQVPHYVSQNASPKAVLALIRALQDQVDEPLPLGELEDEAAAWQRGVDELARTDPDVAEYVERLERTQDAAELPDATGDAIAREFEQFLKRRHDDD